MLAKITKVDQLVDSIKRKIPSRIKISIKKYIKKIVNNIRYPIQPPSCCIQTKDYLELNGCVQLTILDKEHTIHRSPPISLYERQHWKFRDSYEYQSPETFIITVTNGRVFGEGVVITPDNLVLRDVSLAMGYPQDKHPILEEGNLPRYQSIDQNIAVISSQDSYGYFHWLFDILPRLFILRKVYGEEDIDLYYVENKKNFQREWLEIVDIPSHKILPAHNKCHIQASKLIVPSLPGNTGNMTKASCSFLKNLAEKKVIKFTSGKKRRIYISRRDARYRNVRNENDVISILEKLGFEVFALSNLSVVDQINLFSNASVIVAPHGAGLSNLVFAEPSTKVLEFFAPEYVNVCYWTLCEQCNLTYYYLIGQGRKYPDFVDPHQSAADIVVDTEELLRMLDKMNLT